MGWLGIRLSIGTVMIGSVCFGIAVDDTLHFMTRYRERLGDRGSERQAIQATLHEVGLPMIGSAVALSIGFAVLRLSEFQPNAEFGVLSSVTMLIGVLGDLVLLPALLVVLKPRIPMPRNA